MCTIAQIEVKDDTKIRLEFSDGTSKVVDFAPFIGDDELTRPLADKEYFKQVRLYENGRGIYWPNGYDACPDYLRNYAGESEPELEGQHKSNQH